ncbi:MAG TPA: sulfurtransferase [Candidatus Baltobacteraceae bacterium]|nr:sulfurtransferase [Candidatus Baltobacteraceae bacterium]
MYTTLIDAGTLAPHVDDADWVIVDCRHALADFSLGRRRYDDAHIPGAFFADVERDLTGEKTGANGRHPLPDPYAFAVYLRGIGVDDATQIVAYDDGGDMFAARFWFLCRWIGHDACAVLDGGIAAWRASALPTTSALPPPRAGTVRAHVRSELVVGADEVLAHLHDPQMQILDARGADRFAGENETVDPVAGHIPGARNRPFKENFGDDAHFKPSRDLRAAFERFGPSGTIVHQCGSGVSAAVNALAMEIAGLPGARLYAGSWSEWIADPARPVTRD